LRSYIFNTNRSRNPHGHERVLKQEEHQSVQTGKSQSLFNLSQKLMTLSFEFENTLIYSECKIN